MTNEAIETKDLEYKMKDWIKELCPEIEEWQASLIDQEVESRVCEMLSEINEQARLLGISGSKEAKLLAERAELFGKLREMLNKVDEQDRLLRISEIKEARLITERSKMLSELRGLRRFDNFVEINDGTPEADMQGENDGRWCDVRHIENIITTYDGLK